MRDKDFNIYQATQEAKERKYESLCLRCGACCGAFEDDPCSHLKKDDEIKYFCDIYEKRFGLQKTVGGRDFVCMPIRDILFKSWSGSWRCVYKKTI